MDITLTLSPITLIDVQFNTPSPSPPLFVIGIPGTFLELMEIHACVASTTALYILDYEMNSNTSVVTNEWDLSSLAYFQETEGPYHTDLPTPEEIHQFLQFQCIESKRTIKSKTVTLSPNQVLTKELRQDLKRWEELIREYVFGLGGHPDHLLACLAHILYCILVEQQYNLAYFFIKRIESARATLKAHLLYGMFLTRLFLYVMENYPHLDNDIYNVVDQAMRPLALRQTRKPQSDRGIHKARYSVSSSSTHQYGSSSHQEDDDENEGTS
ncbi:hypothetical protein Tco_1053823 [Tanacetum coccineum]|uniref:Uncharacterized protein n=1 Tax=Tanacetum coccineum TaxID=301880 RepID=A0ABQ5GW92_9ASTR